MSKLRGVQFKPLRVTAGALNFFGEALAIRQISFQKRCILLRTRVEDRCRFAQSRQLQSFALLLKKNGTRRKRVP